MIFSISIDSTGCFSMRSETTRKLNRMCEDIDMQLQVSECVKSDILGKLFFEGAERIRRSNWDAGRKLWTFSAICKYFLLSNLPGIRSCSALCVSIFKQHFEVQKTNKVQGQFCVCGSSLWFWCFTIAKEADYSRNAEGTTRCWRWVGGWLGARVDFARLRNLFKDFF